MIYVRKASAGSGKTYYLANFYLKLLRERYAYRHILAVTFTNKATAEMKSRILEFLSESPDPARKQALADILHDYSAFAVSTIDKFFQQALKAFAREIGQTADYQIELDRDALIKESMDRILDSLGSDSAGSAEILDWLKQNVDDSLERGRRVNLEEPLYEMGKRLMSEERRELAAAHGIDPARAFSKERLAAVRNSCRQVIKDFTAKVNESAKDVVVSKANSIKQLAPYLEGYKEWETIPALKATLAKEAEGTRFADLMTGREFKVYNTAVLLRDMAFSLGLAGEFYRSFEALLKEKNVLSLDESNTILKDIIAGSDAPFVYEKLGVRYENFLLDEFQDTSNIQWDNFLPLLRESDSYRHDSLIVGDVKQSIYRWRNSDWRLLAEKVGKCFPDAEEQSGVENWRSCREIVEFNNSFFKSAAAKMGVSGLYSDVEQAVKSRDPQGGHVQVSFCQDSAAQTERVAQSVDEALKAGARYGDIAILVRKRSDGTAIAADMIKRGIPVISDDSLTLKSSRIVRKLIGLLSNHENPDDRINAFIARAEQVEFPSEFHSLVDLCENLLRQLKAASPEDFEGETLYIQAFMDDLREWVDTNGNELRYYLQHWKENDCTIGSPEALDSVRIITVHKSKGLEFKYLIFPFAEKVTFYHADWHWCWLPVEGTPFAPEVEGIYPVELNSKSIQSTLFADAYEQERKMQLIDNLNIFYVALTRAEKCLHVIAKAPSKTFLNSRQPEYSNCSELLFDHCGRMDEWSCGTMYDFTRMQRKTVSSGATLPYSYVSVPVGDRLRVSSDASDFFGEDGATGPAASPRRNGIVLHGILSQVQSLSGLRAAVDAAVLDGQIPAEEGEEAFKLLSERISSHPSWFSGKGLNESAVFGVDGVEKRPDRVIFDGNDVLVIDYKFGERTTESDSRYSRQVHAYMKIFRDMGYRNVSGAVWYVLPDNVLTL